jgi:diguanylate cyclase (GGDEF)-like protein
MTKKLQKAKTSIVQEHPDDAPAGWAPMQEQLAASSGLSLLLIDGHQPPAVLVSNNNSICHAFQSSPEYVNLCDPYCGEAHRRAMSTGGVATYKCHAGLECFTAPVQVGKEKKLAVIGGRAFVTGADYRAIVERLRGGDLEELLEKNPFANVIFAEQSRLEQLANRVQQAAHDFNRVATNQNGGSPATQRSTKKEIQSAASRPASELQREVDHLRHELEYRTRFAESMRHFLERINSSDPQKTYSSILTNSKELLQAERASLLVLDETQNELVMKAGVGLPIDVSQAARIRLGEGVAGSVVESGKPLLVENIESVGLRPAPLDRRYKTKSFISYPIAIGARTVGVLNVTDKSGGGKYDDVDLSLVEIIGPQIALALERAEWQERAKEFQLMSITDPLTGLLNRRYLEERLNEELNRSKRYGQPMSFLMIDIDDFKRYNDLNGHQAGDQALQITAHCLKAALRSADVACRYGGEEFGILLPQTPINEAGVIAERMRQKVSSTDYPQGKLQPLGRVTISIGVSTFGKHVDDPDRVIAAADRALYNAKSRGKNQIEFYQDE